MLCLRVGSLGSMLLLVDYSANPDIHKAFSDRFYVSQATRDLRFQWLDQLLLLNMLYHMSDFDQLIN